MRALAALAALGAVHCGRSAPNPGGESQAGPPAQGAGKSHISGAEPTKLTVAAIAVVDVAPLHLGVAKGLFATEGLDVVVQSTQGGAESVPGVVSGQYQLGYANVVSLVLAHSKGLPLKLIAAGDFSLGKADDFGAVVVPPGSSLQTLKQLEGKTLAVNQVNNIGGVTVRAAMRQAGGDPDQLKFIELRFPEMPAALGQNRVDAAWLVEPFLTVAREQGARVIDWNFADAVPNLMIGAYFTTEGYIQSHPDVVARFTRAINRSLVYASEHPDEARASLLTYTKIDKLVADKLTLPLWSPQIGRDSMKRLAELMVQDKLIPRAPDLDALVR
jgi:NitT/TauT family transport system substrate-binding protein